MGKIRDAKRGKIGKHHLPIWGIDSESQGDLLTLVLAASEHGERQVVAGPSGVTTKQVFEFLLSLPRGLKVIFAGGYDASMWLRDLPFGCLNRLRLLGECSWEKYRIKHIPAKMFRVSDGRRTCTIWDVWGWCQSSFVRMLDEWDLGTDEQRRRIRTMKEQRAAFSDVELTCIIEYTTDECVLLARWVRLIIQLHQELHLRLNSYCGGGSTAAAIYRAYGWSGAQVSDDIVRIALAAYYGGRNELCGMGEWPYGQVRQYDIRSAYHFAISQLPSLGGGWKHTRKAPKGDWFGFARVQWDLPLDTVWGPFPVRRAPLASGKRAISLLYPVEGSGWYHSYEVREAPCKVLEAWVLEHDGSRPFDWVNELARKRIEYKLAGDGRHRVLKFGLNSLYGKMAQRKGPPQWRRYWNPVYAAAITAHTRSRIYGLLRDYGRRILMVATDGIVTDDSVSLETGEQLGDWELASQGEYFIAVSIPF